MAVRVGSGAERVILCLGFSDKVDSKIRTRSGGRSVRLVRLPSAREPRTYTVHAGVWSGGRSVFLVRLPSAGQVRSGGRSVWPVRLPGSHRDAVRRSVSPAGPVAWEGTTGMRSGSRLVRSVRLPEKPRGCGPAVGRSGWSSCLENIEDAVRRSVGPAGPTVMGTHGDAVQRSVGPPGPAALGSQRDAVRNCSGTRISPVGQISVAVWASHAHSASKLFSSFQVVGVLLTGPMLASIACHLWLYVIWACASLAMRRLHSIGT
jgi:hypothetical protein